MNCRRATRFLSKYLDGNLKSNLKKELESHLEGCTSCSSELASLQKVEKMLKLKAGEHPSPEYWESFWPRLSRRLEETLEQVKVPLIKRVRLAEIWERLSYPFLPEPRLALNVVIVILLGFTLILSHQRGKEINLLQARLDQAQEVQTETLELLAAYTSQGYPIAVANALIKERSIGELIHQLQASYSKEELDGFMTCFSPILLV